MRKLVLSSLFAFLNLLTFAQWDRLPGPYGGPVYDIVQDVNGLLFARTPYNVFKSFDNGMHWIDLEINHTQNFIPDLISTPEGYIFLATGNELLRSEDGGITWTNVNGMPGKVLKVGYHSVGTILTINDVEVGSSFNISHDNGETWSTTQMGYWIYDHSIVVDSSGVIYLLNHQFQKTELLTSHNGTIWDTIPINQFKSINDFKADSSGRLYIAYSNEVIPDSLEYGIVSSIDNGHTWQKIFDGEVNRIFYTEQDTIMILNYKHEMFTSTDDGLTWMRDTLSFFPAPRTIHVLPDQLLAATNDGVYVSFDNGNIWDSSSEGLLSQTFNSIAISDSGTILTITGGHYSGPMFRSDDNGNTWNDVSEDFNFTYDKVYNSGRHLWVSSYYDSILYRSNDNGEWDQLQIPTTGGVWALSASENGNTMVITDWAGNLLRSADFGNTVTNINNLFPEGTQFDQVFHLNNDTIILVTRIDFPYKSTMQFSVDIYRSTDAGYTWEVVKPNLDYWNNGWRFQIVKDSFGNLFVTNDQSTLLRSTDGGSNWEYVNLPFLTDQIYLIPAVDGNLYAIFSWSSIYSTDDLGDTWVNITNGLPGYFPLGTASNTGELFICAQDFGIYKQNLLVTEATSEIKEVNSFSVFPNPASLKLYLNYPNWQQHYRQQFSLYDVTGKLIKSIYPSSVQTTIDVSQFKPGTYFLNKQGGESVKIMIE